METCYKVFKKDVLEKINICEIDSVLNRKFQLNSPSKMLEFTK